MLQTLYTVPVSGTRELAAVHPIPNLSKDVAEDVAHNRGNDNERHGCREIKGRYDIRYVDHVHPENEIDNRLCQSENDESRPNKMHKTDEHAYGKRSLCRVDVMVHEIMLCG